MCKQYKINDYLRRVESIALRTKIDLQGRKENPIKHDGVYGWLRVLYKCLVELEGIFFVLCANDYASAT